MVCKRRRNANKKQIRSINDVQRRTWQMLWRKPEQDWGGKEGWGNLIAILTGWAGKSFWTWWRVRARLKQERGWVRLTRLLCVEYSWQREWPGQRPWGGNTPGMLEKLQSQRHWRGVRWEDEVREEVRPAAPGSRRPPRGCGNLWQGRAGWLMCRRSQLVDHWETGHHEGT